MIGIYKITNTINHKVYIGQSVNIAKRWSRHKQSKMKYPLYQDFVTYGIHNFNFEVVETCTRAQLNTIELYYIKLYHANNPQFGYNQTLSADVIYGHSTVFTYDSLQDLFDDLFETELTKEELAAKYNCSERTIRDINAGRTWIREDINYPIRKHWQGVDGKMYACNDFNGIKPEYICKMCGTQTKTKNSLCVACGHKSLQTVTRPDANQLLEDIATSSFVEVGKKYGVSDNAIRKWCKAYKLPTTKKEIVSLYKQKQ